jgi:hypothetical protein
MRMDAQKMEKEVKSFHHVDFLHYLSFVIYKPWGTINVVRRLVEVQRA